MIGEIIEIGVTGVVLCGVGYVFGPRVLMAAAGSFATNLQAMHKGWDNELAAKHARQEELEALDHRVRVAAKRQEVIRQEVLTQKMFEVAQSQSGEVALNAAGKLMLTGKEEAAEGRRNRPTGPLARPLQVSTSYPLLDNSPPEWMRQMTGIPSDPIIGSDAQYIDRLNATYSRASELPHPPEG